MLKQKLPFGSAERGDAVGHNKVEGLPILAEELERAILEQIER